MTTERNIQEWVSRSRPGSRNPSESSSKGSDMGVEVSQLPLDTWSNLSHFEDYPRRHLTKEELYAHFPDGWCRRVLSENVIFIIHAIRLL